MVHLSSKIDQLEDREDRLFHKFHSELSIVTTTITNFASQVDKARTVMEKKGQEDMKDGAGQEDAMHIVASGASASGWAVDHQVRGGKSNRDGGNKDHPKAKMSLSGSDSYDESTGGDSSDRRSVRRPTLGRHLLGGHESWPPRRWRPRFRP